MNNPTGPSRQRLKTADIPRKEKKITFTHPFVQPFPMEPLFANMFPSINKAAWLAQVQKDLNDEFGYESLRWKTAEGFTVDPYYTAESFKDLSLGLIQKAQKSTTGWLNTPEYRISDAKIANALLRDGLTRGADALLLNLSVTNSNLSQLLNGIKLSDTPVFFRLISDTNISTLQQPDLANFIGTLRTIAPYQLKGGLLMDVSDIAVETTHLTADSPQFRTVCVSSHVFHNAGASATQELAYTLASLADVYDKLTDNGLMIDQLIPKTMLSISVGTSYFLEIAKLRALRVLFQRFTANYPSASADSGPADQSLFIHCQTSTFYDAAITPYTNLLRATTEAMAAVIGGCNGLTVHPYDTVLLNQSNRKTRNLLTALPETCLLY